MVKSRRNVYGLSERFLGLQRDPESYEYLVPLFNWWVRIYVVILINIWFIYEMIWPFWPFLIIFWPGKTHFPDFECNKDRFINQQQLQLEAWMKLLLPVNQEKLNLTDLKDFQQIVHVSGFCNYFKIIIKSSLKVL